MESELWEWRLCGLCTSGAGVASEQDERRLWEKMATQDRNGKLVVIWQAYAIRGEAYRKNGEGGNSLRLNIRWWRKKKHTTEWMTERKQPEAWNWITIQIHQNPSMPNPRQSGTRIKKARKILGGGEEGWGDILKPDQGSSTDAHLHACKGTVESSFRFTSQLFWVCSCQRTENRKVSL